MYVIKGSEVPTENRGNLEIKVFPTEHLTKKTEFIFVDCKTSHGNTIIQRESDFVYYIVEGEGHFEIEDKKENCAAGDLVVVPAGKKYNYYGAMKLVASSTPPWKAEQQIVV